MDEELTEEKVRQLMRFPGEIKGIDIKDDGDFILKKAGKEGLDKVEKVCREAGVPISYRKINAWGFYPGGTKVVSLLAIKKALGFDNQKIEEMAQTTSQKSFIIKLSLRFFFNIPKFIFQETPKIWTKYWTVGELVPVEYNEKKRYAIVRVKDMNLHPLYCVYLKGFFSAFPIIGFGTREVAGEETKCSFKGDEYHEFVIRWK